MGILTKFAAGANKFSEELLNPTNAVGKLGAYLGASAGTDLGLASLAAQRDAQAKQGTELERQLQMMKLEQMRNPKPRLENVGGGLYSIDANGNPTEIIPRQPDEPPALQQNFSWYKGLGPEDQKVAARMLPGYGFSPEGIAAKVNVAGQVANVQGAAREAHRAPPRASTGRAPKAAKIPSGFILD